jgi:hypothetical protein
MKKLLPITRFGRIRTTDEISTVRDGKTVITHPRTLVEVEADNGVVVGIVDLAHLLGDMSRRLATQSDQLAAQNDQLAAQSDRLAAVEALAKVERGDTPEVARLKKQISATAKGRKKASDRSAEVRGKKRERWLAEIGAHIRTKRTDEPDLTKDEIITLLTDETKPWPFKFRRLSRSSLQKAKALWE